MKIEDTGMNTIERHIVSTDELISSLYRLCKLLRREVPCHVKDILRKETY